MKKMKRTRQIRDKDDVINQMAEPTMSRIITRSRRAGL